MAGQIPGMSGPLPRVGLWCSRAGVGPQAVVWRPPGLDNVGSLTSHNPIGLRGLETAQFVFAVQYLFKV
jgi:hypothetical protein